MSDGIPSLVIGCRLKRMNQTHRSLDVPPLSPSPKNSMWKAASSIMRRKIRFRNRKVEETRHRYPEASSLGMIFLAHLSPDLEGFGTRVVLYGADRLEG